MSHPTITEECFTFLRELSENNHRPWFQENKHRYHRFVLDPAVAFVAELAGPLSKIAPILNPVAKAHGGSVMRIYKDTRFSKDKKPYKTNVGISIRHQAGADIHAPGIYIHIAPDQCFLGAGLWRPDRTALSAIRETIDADPTRWKRIRDRKTFRRHFELAGDQLKTAPRGFRRDHPLIDDLRRIDFIAVCPLTHEQIVADDAIARIVDQVRAAKPWMVFLCDAVGLPY